MIKSVNLKYQRFTQSGCKDLGTRNLCLWQKCNSVETSNPGLNEKMFYFYSLQTHQFCVDFNSAHPLLSRLHSHESFLKKKKKNISFTIPMFRTKKRQKRTNGV